MYWFLSDGICVMDLVLKVWKSVVMSLGGMVGWLVAECEPAFPLIVVAVVFILYDAWTAFKLDRRARALYPDRTRREKAKFTSFAFGKVVKVTIPKRLWVIVLAYMVEHWVFVYIDVPLSYVVTGVICFEQAWSILENESSCRPEDENRLWRMLQRIMVDKTARHLNVDPEELRERLNGKKD